MDFIRTFYGWLIRIGSQLSDYVLLAIRLLWGVSLYQTGYGKLTHIDGVAQFFSSLGIPFPEFHAYLVGGVEFLAGICFILGLATRLISIPLIISMIVALLTTSFAAVKGIFDDPSNFIKQDPVSYLLVALILFCFGPGKISLDYLLKKFVFRRPHTELT
jgi:putative oxidoreductase